MDASSIMRNCRWKLPGGRQLSIRRRCPNPKRCTSRCGSRESQVRLSTHPSNNPASNPAGGRFAMAAPAEDQQKNQQKKKYYTIDEANNALPLVRAIVTD